MTTPGENAQLRATAGPTERLEWQSELDSALADIDARLTHPRRRASDVVAQPAEQAELSQVNITSELLDEIAWRVSQQMRRQAALEAPLLAAKAVVAPQPPPAPVSTEPAIPPGVVLVIRFRWPFRRRKKMIQLSDYRGT
jgi:hypothetical protein